MTNGFDRAAFLEERKSGIGGSEAAAALGLSNYKTPARLWAEKRGLIEPEDLAGNVAVELGTRLEDVIADMYADRHEAKVHRVNQTLRHPTYPFMLAHIDRRIVGERRGLECKTAGLVSGRPDPDWGEGADEVPRDYFLQVQHYLAVTSYMAFDVAAIIAGKGYIEYTIRRDEELIDMVIQGERDFWRLVEEGVEPAVVDVDDARRRWPKSVAKEIQASPEIVAIDAALRVLEEDEKRIEKEIDAHQTALMAYMGEFDTLVAGKQKLRTWRTQSATRLDTENVKSYLAEAGVLDDYLKTSSTRVFRKVAIK